MAAAEKRGETPKISLPAADAFLNLSIFVDCLSKECKSSEENCSVYLSMDPIYAVVSVDNLVYRPYGHDHGTPFRKPILGILSPALLVAAHLPPGALQGENIGT